MTLIVSKFSIQDQNKINFLRELFEYVLHNIKKEHIIDILTYIVYSLVYDDTKIPKIKVEIEIEKLSEKRQVNCQDNSQ